MKAPRCKICQSEHRLGPCPDTMTDKFVDAMFPKTKPRPAFRNRFEDAARGRDTMTKTNPRAGAEPQISPTVHGGKAVGRTASSIPATGAKPRFDLAEQVRKLGADSLLPPAKPKKAKKKPAKAKAKKRAKKGKRSTPAKPKPRKPMPPGGLHPRVGRPLPENKPYTLAATEPWLKMKPPVSRATYFRRKRRDGKKAVQ